MANSDRMTIYMTEQDKEAAEALKAELIKRGVNLNSNQNKPSISELFRYLVRQELERINKYTPH